MGEAEVSDGSARAPFLFLPPPNPILSPPPSSPPIESAAAHQSTRCQPAQPSQSRFGPSPGHPQHPKSVPTSRTGAVQSVTVPLPVRPLSFRLGLVSGPHAPAPVPVSLNSHTHSRTAPHCCCLVLLVLLMLLLLPLLGDPSIHPSFPVLRVVPPLFLSLNLFSLFTLVAKITILSLIFDPSYPSPSTGRIR
ncbi:hypothetical protein CKAH01_09906 [Colletotrichum kahawae]|uniref:Uncharacterized protein n=1 Tax=Colletotrichum kahawae TaxID=34407 RepID=A0AAD9Y014_COLKA|nr:hypothetical protein CKAH01_09906 [Colletotrichum kahawae]